MGSTLVAALCGVVLAAFANSVSSSILARAAVVGVGGVVGGAAGRTAGAVFGLVCGVIAAAGLSAVGGSVLGMAVLVVGSAALGGWLQYAHGGNNSSTERPCRCRPSTQSEGR